MNKFNKSSILLLAGLLLILLFTACTNCNTPTTIKKEVTPTLLVIIDDPSSTDKGNDISKVQYQELCNKLCTRQVGDVIYVLSAGDVKKQDATLMYKASTKPAISADATLRVRRVLNARADSLKAHSQRDLDNFYNQLDTVVINYKPIRKDITNLDRPFALADIIFSDKEFSSYTKILVVVSDGIHEDKSGSRTPMTTILSDNHSITIFQTGWKGDKSCFGKYVIEDKADVKTLFLTISNQFN